jgi:hypothetical protein
MGRRRLLSTLSRISSLVTRLLMVRLSPSCHREQLLIPITEQTITFRSSRTRYLVYAVLLNAAVTLIDTSYTLFTHCSFDVFFRCLDRLHNRILYFAFDSVFRIYCIYSSTTCFLTRARDLTPRRVSTAKFRPVRDLAVGGREYICNRRPVQPSESWP